MRKLVLIFLLIVALSSVFAGAVSAQIQPTVDVVVLDKDGAPVSVTYPGNEVKVQIDAKAHLTRIQQPFANVTVHSDTSLVFGPENAVMYYNQYGPFKNNPNDPFFFWSNQLQSWIWYIGWYGGYWYPNDYAQLIVPATITELGKITVKADLYGWPVDKEPGVDPPLLLNSNSYTFPSELFQPSEPDQTNKTPVGTVPMQTTGSTVAIAALGLLGIIVGVFYGKIR